jgi:ribosomal protein S18 acetylase RimI-like enzyme
MNSATISLVDARTLDAVVGLFEAQLREHEITSSREDLRLMAETVMRDRRYGFMLVASASDGSPIGVAYASSLLSLEHGGVSGWIEELYVSPQWRGQGIGSRLIEEVVSRAKEAGWRALDLEVDATHQRAKALYARHQFRSLRRSRFYRALELHA